MKKILFIICCVLPISIFAQQVSQSEAEIVAHNFFVENYLFTKGSKPVGVKFKTQQELHKNNQSKTLYIFNNENNKGFVIIAGNKAAHPVLAYSLKENFNEKTTPPAVNEWLDVYRNQIKLLHQSHSTSDLKTKAVWEKYSDPLFAEKLALKGAKSSTKNVAPLLTTTWNQGAYYNALCPETASGGSGGHVWAGCVATAQAQIMKYYNYPDQGVGEYSYTHSVYGVQSANFGATTYDWSNMPSSLSSHNTDIATLLYHCGVAVNMNYGPSGSGASGGAPKNSLINYFKYSGNTLYTHKYAYTEEDWKNLLKREIDEGRPLYYVGNGTGGHAFNCDGYQDDDYFHFNWGWGGSYNGYFYLNDLTPGGNDFSNSQAALVGAVPKTMETDLDSTSAVVISCGSAYNGTTTDGENIVNVYNGSAWQSTGKEKVHKITTSYPGRISASITNTQGKNLDVFILQYANRNSTLAAGDSIAFADDTEAGTYYILVDGRYGAEGNYTLVVNCPDNQADLIVEDAKVRPMYVVAGAQMKVDAVIRNIGNSSAPESVLNFYVSDDEILSSEDTLVGNESVEALNQQSTSNISTMLNLPLSVGGGMKFIILKVDANNDVTETNELLNTTFTSFEVPNAGVMNCSSAVGLQNGVWYHGNTSTNGSANISDYSWFFGLENKEVIHEFTPSFSGMAKLTFTEVLDGNLNLILLSGCNENACINSFALYHEMSDTLQQEFYVIAGITYYLVADGTNQYGNAEGAYSLKIDFPDECPSPVISSSSTDKCIGDGNAYLYTNWEYSNYQWLKNGLEINGESNNSFSTNENGVYSVKVTENGCTGESESVQVTYSEKPTTSDITALSNTEFCKGSSVTLELSTGTGYTYQWTHNNKEIFGANALTYNATESGTYKAKVTNQSCTIQTNGIEVVAKHSAYEPGQPLSITTDSLITNWQFDSWGTDESGYGNNAGINGASQCKDRDDNYSAFRFSGIESYIYSSKQFQSPDTFTIAVWFKTSTSGPILGFDSERMNNSSTDFGRCFYIDDNGKLCFGIDNGAKNVLVSTLACNDGSWHLAAASLSPEGMKLYLDGQFEDGIASVTNGKAISGYWKVAHGHLELWPACSNLYFAGSIDDIRIYKRALSNDEIEVLYQQQVINVVLEDEAICAASGSTNIVIENSEPGIAYLLVDDDSGMPIGSSTDGTAGTIHLPTGILNTTTNIKILAENLATSCINEFDSVYSVTVGEDITPEVHISSNANLKNFCKGDTISFSQSTFYGGSSPTYNWLVNGYDIGSNESHLSINSLDNQDIVSLEVISSAECANPEKVTSNEITVNINDLPVVDIGPDKSIGTDETLTLDAGEGFESYLWSTDETTQQILIDGILGVGEYEYSVLVTDVNDCSNSDTVLIEIKSVLSADFKGKDLLFKAWPNPIKDFLHFEYAKSLSEKFELEIYNNSGQQLHHKTYYTESKIIKDKIYMGQYQNGIYFLVIKSKETGKKVIKLLVEK
jgi:hypothetical protein